MKKVLLFSVVWLVMPWTFGQGIDNSEAKPTITPQEIIALGQDRAPMLPTDPILLDFEGLGNRDFINEFYNGGTSGLGFSGPNYGVSVVDGRGLIDDDAGGTGNFANEPSPETIMYFPNTDRVFINVAAGFTTGISFYYVSSLTGWVGVYDGPDGTGTLLMSKNLTDTKVGNKGGDPNGHYDSWYPVSFEFDGTGRSVVFIGGSDAMGIDNLVLGDTYHREIPLSDWAIYLGIGLIVLLLAFRFARYSRA